jgi:hypothetical protein
MAAKLEGQKQTEIHDNHGGLLIRALRKADGHDLRDIRAFANGCDDNAFIESLVPVMPADLGRLRQAFNDIFKDGHLDTAWENWTGIGKEKDDKTGLNTFLACKGRSRRNPTRDRLRVA